MCLTFGEGRGALGKVRHVSLLARFFFHDGPLARLYIYADHGRLNKLHDAVYSRRNKDDRSKPRVFIGSYNLYPCQTKTSGRKIVRPIPHLHL